METWPVSQPKIGQWRSPLDGAQYPSGWWLEVPSRSLDLEIRPLIPDQELQLTFRYWEGAVVVRGRGSEGPVEGKGYVELTGYVGPGTGSTLNPKVGSPTPGLSNPGGSSVPDLSPDGLTPGGILGGRPGTSEQNITPLSNRSKEKRA